MAVIFHIAGQRGVVHRPQAVLPQFGICGNRGSILEGDTVRRNDVGVQRGSGVVPDALAIDTGPVGKNKAVAGPKRIAVIAIGLAHIRAQDLDVDRRRQSKVR